MPRNGYDDDYDRGYDEGRRGTSGWVSSQWYRQGVAQREADDRKRRRVVVEEKPAVVIRRAQQQLERKKLSDRGLRDAALWRQRDAAQYASSADYRSAYDKRIRARQATVRRKLRGAGVALAWIAVLGLLAVLFPAQAATAFAVMLVVGGLWLIISFLVG